MKLNEAFEKIRKTIPLMVAEAEKAMADGRITQDERKPLVKKMIQIIASQFGIKLNWLAWLILSFAIDRAARLLPSKDIILPIVSMKF